MKSIGNWRFVYESFLVIWIVFGLGYVFMIVTVIADALRKPARKAVKTFRGAAERVFMGRVVNEILQQRAKVGSIRLGSIREGCQDVQGGCREGIHGQGGQ